MLWTGTPHLAHLVPLRSRAIFLLLLIGFVAAAALAYSELVAHWDHLRIFKTAINERSYISKVVWAILLAIAPGGLALRAFLLVYVARRRLRDQVYVLTDRHAIVLSESKSGSQAIKKTMPEASQIVTKSRGDGSGYIILGYEIVPTRTRTNSKPVLIRRPRMIFDEIENIAAVLLIVQDAIAARRPTFSSQE